jgi:hypothetical protein
MLFVTSAALADTPADSFRSASAATFEHTIDFLVTIAIAAFAALGYLVKDSELTSSRPRVWQIAIASVALLATLGSLLFSYLAYLDLIAMTGSGAFDYSALPHNYAVSAFLLLADGVCIYLVLVITTIWKKR